LTEVVTHSNFLSIMYKFSYSLKATVLLIHTLKSHVSLYHIQYITIITIML